MRLGKDRDFMFVEGVRLAEESLLSSISVSEAWIREDFGAVAREAEIIKNLTERGVLIRSLSERVFAKLADTDSPQGVCLIAERPKPSEQDIEQALLDSQISVMLYKVNNPANLGAVIRTAEAAGVGTVFLTKDSADPYSVKALRSSMGSAFRMPIFNNVDGFEILNDARTNGTTSFCLSGTGSEDITKIEISGRVLAVFGAEAHGLPSEIVDRCDKSVLIPMAGKVESLNLAVSAGITLYEIKRWGNSAPDR